MLKQAASKKTGRNCITLANKSVGSKFPSPKNEMQPTTDDARMSRNALKNRFMHLEKGSFPFLWGIRNIRNHVGNLDSKNRPSIIRERESWITIQDYEIKKPLHMRAKKSYKLLCQPPNILQHY